MAEPKRKPIKKTSETPSDVPLSKLDKAKVDQLFAEALKRYKNDDLLEKKQKVKEISHLSSIIEEYLSCFILIGYSIQDEEVVMYNASTSKDESALIDLLRNTFLDMNGNHS